MSTGSIQCAGVCTSLPTAGRYSETAILFGSTEGEVSTDALLVFLDVGGQLVKSGRRKNDE